ncbi:MAG: MFS transporter, partial [Myxococcota bacterium]
MRPSIRSLPRALIVLYVATVVTRVGTFVVPYLTIYLAGERGLSMAATGNVVAAGGIGMVAGNLLGGVLADNRGRKLALLTAIAVNVLGISLLSLSL